MIFYFIEYTKSKILKQEKLIFPHYSIRLMLQNLHLISRVQYSITTLLNGLLNTGLRISFTNSIKRITKLFESFGLITKNNNLKFRHMSYWENSPNMYTIEKT